METVRLTMAQAIVRWLVNQRTVIDGAEVPLFAGVSAIFGHGNVTCLGEALQPVQDVLPTWHGHNEQAMALTAVAFAKAKRRRQIMIATSSIGPGCTNMVTAAAVAHTNRLPLLLLSGDTYQHRIVDPVLQQIELFNDPTVTVCDTMKPVTRYWDRITKPEQIVRSLPQALAVMLDPADCGPAFFALPQDVQAEAYDYPTAFFEPRVHYIRRPGPDSRDIDVAADLLRGATKPLIISGGGVHYSGAVEALTAFAERHAIPVVETLAGKAAFVHDHPNYAGPIGVNGSPAAQRDGRRRRRRRRRSARACRTSPPGRGLCSRTRRCVSCRSTPRGGMPSSNTPRRSSATRSWQSSNSMRPSATSPRPRIGWRSANRGSANGTHISTRSSNARCRMCLPTVR